MTADSNELLRDCRLLVGLGCFEKLDACCRAGNLPDEYWPDAFVNQAKKARDLEAELGQPLFICMDCRRAARSSSTTGPNCPCCNETMEEAAHD